MVATLGTRTGFHNRGGNYLSGLYRAFRTLQLADVNVARRLHPDDRDVDVLFGQRGSQLL